MEGELTVTAELLGLVQESISQLEIFIQERTEIINEVKQEIEEFKKMKFQYSGKFRNVPFRSWNKTIPEGRIKKLTDIDRFNKKMCDLGINKSHTALIEYTSLYYNINFHILYLKKYLNTLSRISQVPDQIKPENIKYLQKIFSILKKNHASESEIEWNKKRDILLHNQPGGISIFPQLGLSGYSAIIFGIIHQYNYYNVPFIFKDKEISNMLNIKIKTVNSTIHKLIKKGSLINYSVNGKDERNLYAINNVTINGILRDKKVITLPFWAYVTKHYTNFPPSEYLVLFTLISKCKNNQSCLLPIHYFEKLLNTKKDTILQSIKALAKHGLIHFNDSDINLYPLIEFELLRANIESLPDQPIENKDKRK